MFKLERDILGYIKLFRNIRIETQFPDTDKFLWNEFIATKNNSEF